MKIFLDQDIQNKAIKLSKLVMAKAEKHNWNDKFVLNQVHGKAEFDADVIGFLGEFAFAEMFNLEGPIFFETSNDVYDFKIANKRIDLKTRLTGKNIYINANQFERKKNIIDLFVFGNIGNNKFTLDGFIEYDKVKEINNIICFNNGSSAYLIEQKDLTDIELLRKI